MPYGTGEVKAWSESAGSAGVRADSWKSENAKPEGPEAEGSEAEGPEAEGGDTEGANADSLNADGAVPEDATDNGDDDFDSDSDGAADDPQPTTQGFTTDDNGNNTAPPRENDVVLPDSTQADSAQTDSMQSSDSDSDSIPPQSDSTSSPELVHTGGSLPFMTIAAAFSLAFAGLTLFITSRRQDS